VSNPLFGPGDELGMTAAHSWSFSERFQIAILCSPEYYRKHGNSDQPWINSLYVRLLGQSESSLPALGGDLPVRTAFANGDAYRQAVAEHFLRRAEYQKRLLVGYYTTYLDRNPSAAELADWFETFKRGTSPEFFQSEILGSEEHFVNQGGSNNVQW